MAEIRDELQLHLNFNHENSYIFKIKSNTTVNNAFCETVGHNQREEIRCKRNEYADVDVRSDGEKQDGYLLYYVIAMNELYLNPYASTTGTLL